MSGDGKRKRRESKLPMSRIRGIMKSSPNVNSIGNDALYSIAKCTELFIQNFTMESLAECQSPRFLDYKGVSKLAKNKPNYNFLTQIVPEKMTIMAVKRLRARMMANPTPQEETKEEEDDEETVTEEEDEDEEEEADGDEDDDDGDLQEGKDRRMLVPSSSQLSSEPSSSEINSFAVRPDGYSNSSGTSSSTSQASTNPTIGNAPAFMMESIVLSETSSLNSSPKSARCNGGPSGSNQRSESSPNIPSSSHTIITISSEYGSEPSYPNYVSSDSDED